MLTWIDSLCGLSSIWCPQILDPKTVFKFSFLFSSFEKPWDLGALLKISEKKKEKKKQQSPLFLLRFWKNEIKEKIWRKGTKLKNEKRTRENEISYLSFLFSEDKRPNGKRDIEKEDRQWKDVKKVRKSVFFFLLTFSQGENHNVPLSNNRTFFTTFQKFCFFIKCHIDNWLRHWVGSLRGGLWTKIIWAQTQTMEAHLI